MSAFPAHPTESLVEVEARPPQPCFVSPLQVGLIADTLGGHVEMDGCGCLHVAARVPHLGPGRGSLVAESLLRSLLPMIGLEGWAVRPGGRR